MGKKNGAERRLKPTAREIGSLTALVIESVGQHAGDIETSRTLDALRKWVGSALQHAKQAGLPTESIQKAAVQLLKSMVEGDVAETILAAARVGIEATSVYADCHYDNFNKLYDYQRRTRRRRKFYETLEEEEAAAEYVKAAFQRINPGNNLPDIKVAHMIRSELERKGFQRNGKVPSTTWILEHAGKKKPKQAKKRI